MIVSPEPDNKTDTPPSEEIARQIQHGRDYIRDRYGVTACPDCHGTGRVGDPWIGESCTNAHHSSPAVEPPAGLRLALISEVARHGDSMSWSHNDAEPVTVQLGCRCGHRRETVTSEQLAADIPGYLDGWRRHVADALLAGPLAPLVEAVREVHQPDGTEPLACDWCGEAWPCSTIRTLDGHV